MFYLTMHESVVRVDGTCMVSLHKNVERSSVAVAMLFVTTATATAAAVIATKQYVHLCPSIASI